MFVAALSLCGCGDDDASSVAPAAPRHPAPAEAVARCSDAVSSLVDAPEEGPVVVLAEGCHGLFAEPACRSAFRDLPDAPPEARAVSLASACGSAYCDNLPLPKPALCSLDPAELTPAELAEAWPELMRAILRRDLGRRYARRLESVLDVVNGPLSPVVRRGALPPGAPPPPPHRLELSRSDEGVSARLRDPDGGEIGVFVLPAAPTTQDAVVIAASLRHPASANVVITAEPDVEYAAVVAAMDALQQRGVEQFVIEPPAAE